MTLLTLILIVVLFTGEVALFFLYFRFFKRLDKRFNGSSGKAILKLLADSMDKSEQVENNLRKFLKDIEQDRKILRNTLHKIGFVRFNPFKDMGGAHSFSIAMLDAQNTGFLVTSLYGKDGVRVYAKEVKGGITEQAIMREEEKALQQAIKN